MQDAHDINHIVQAYHKLPKNLTDYLPDAMAVDLQRSTAATCEDMTVLLKTLKRYFSEQAVSGWLTFKSTNLLLQKDTQWFERVTELAESGSVLQAELVADEKCVSIHYESGKWHLSLMSVCESEKANSLAVLHSFAIDPQRFPCDAFPEQLREIQYWVIWQTQTEVIDSAQQQLIPVAQCLRGINDTGIVLEDENKKEGVANA